MGDFQKGPIPLPHDNPIDTEETLEQLLGTERRMGATQQDDCGRDHSPGHFRQPQSFVPVVGELGDAYQRGFMGAKNALCIPTLQFRKIGHDCVEPRPLRLCSQGRESHRQQ
jgi:hypothetical protein